MHQALRLGLNTASRVVRITPYGSPRLHKVRRWKNENYGPKKSPHHRVDLYAPKAPKGPMPLLLYVHGGAFQMLSKDTHWMMGIKFASMGFLVASINYRLAPKHRYPAGLEDCCEALRWFMKNAPQWGGDPEQIVLAGESAGANLVTSVALCATTRRDEPWAEAVYQAAPKIRAVLPACGIFQVTDTDRISRRRGGRLPNWIHGNLRGITKAYLPHADCAPGTYPLADPLLLLEQETKFERPLPPFLIGVGTRDPLLDDSRRLARACDDRKITNSLKIYPGGVHAFHAVPWTSRSKAFWSDTQEFLNAVLNLTDSQ